MMLNRDSLSLQYYIVYIIAFFSIQISGCVLTMPAPDSMKRYPELESLAEHIKISAEEMPHIAIAGILITKKEDKGAPGTPSDKYTELLLESTYAGILSESPSYPASLYKDIPEAVICGAQSGVSASSQDVINCMLPGDLSASPVLDELLSDNVTHLILISSSIIKIKGEREVTWGVAAGYGGAAPAFTTETFVTHKFNVHARIYDVNSGMLLSEASISDEDEGSYGVMAMIMPYRIRVDDDAYVELMGRRLGEELGRRFMRGKADH